MGGWAAAGAVIGMNRNAFWPWGTVSYLRVLARGHGWNGSSPAWWCSPVLTDARGWQVQVVGVRRCLWLLVAASSATGAAEASSR
eukprot:gene7844-biopygen18076